MSNLNESFFSIQNMLCIQMCCHHCTKSIGNLRWTLVCKISLQTNLSNTNISLTPRYGPKGFVVLPLLCICECGHPVQWERHFTSILLTLETLRSSNDLPLFVTEAIQKRLMFPICGFRHLSHNCLRIENNEFHSLHKLFTVVKKVDFLISTNMQTKVYKNQC